MARRSTWSGNIWWSTWDHCKACGNLFTSKLGCLGIVHLVDLYRPARKSLSCTSVYWSHIEVMPTVVVRSAVVVTRVPVCALLFSFHSTERWMAVDLEWDKWWQSETCNGRGTPNLKLLGLVFSHMMAVKFSIQLHYKACQDLFTNASHEFLN